MHDAKRQQRRRKQSLNLAGLAVLVLVAVLYLSFLLSQAPYGKKHGKSSNGKASKLSDLKWGKMDLAELEEGGEVALVQRPPKTVHPVKKKTDAPPTEAAEGDVPEKEEETAPPTAEATKPPANKRKAKKARVTEAPPTDEPDSEGEDETPAPVTKKPKKAKAKAAGHAMHDGASPKETEFPHIHAFPLGGELERESLPGAVTARTDSFEHLVATNPILAKYKHVKPNTDDEFFDSDGQKQFWAKRPALRGLLERFQQLNKDMRKGSIPKRYVTVTPVGQLCNRLVAITSAFFFALLTKRGLLVDDSGFYAASSDLFEDPGMPWLDFNTVGYSSAQHVIRNPESGVWPETENLLCSDYDDEYGNAKVVHFNVNQYLLPYMTENPHYRESVTEIFGTIEVFHAIQRFLFRPIKKLRDERDAYLKKHFAGHFVVGLQIRSGPDFTSNFVNSNDLTLYRDCAASVTPEEKRDKMKYFIATDTEDGRKAAAKALGKDKVIFGPGPFLLSNHPRGVQMALMDIMLLASSDDRINTAWSSYGYFSAGMSGFPAAMVVDQAGTPLIAPPGREQRFMGVPHKSDRRRQCVRLPTVQPCFHKFESWGASKATCFSKDMFEREMLNGRYC